jgi:hypothetical protein
VRSSLPGSQYWFWLEPVSQHHDPCIGKAGLEPIDQVYSFVAVALDFDDEQDRPSSLDIGQYGQVFDCLMPDGEFPAGKHRFQTNPEQRIGANGEHQRCGLPLRLQGSPILRQFMQ